MILLAPVAWAGAFLIHTSRPNESVHSAVWADDANRVNELLDRSPELLESRNRMDRTPLLRAVEENRIEMMKLLISRGADVNSTTDIIATGDGNWNGLHLAAHYDLQEPARILIQAGTSIHARNRKGQTPLELATKHMHWNIVSLIQKHGDATRENRLPDPPMVKLHPNQILPPSP